MMTQTAWASPKFTIDCMLANGSTQLEADGCVLACVEDGHTLTTPDHLRVGDTVNVQLRLEGEEAFIDIRLAVVTRVHNHWITGGRSRALSFIAKEDWNNGCHWLT
jgi:hypothetical protein